MKKCIIGRTYLSSKENHIREGDNVSGIIIILTGRQGNRLDASSRNMKAANILLHTYAKINQAYANLCKT